MRAPSQLLAFCLFSFPFCLSAQNLESQKQVTAFLERRAREITEAAAREIGSVAAWEKVRARRLEEMRDMLGLLPWPARTPIHPRVTGTLDGGDYLVEKIVFESLPKFYVTGNLYLPKRRAGRQPAIVYVCGHALSPYGAKTQYQRHGISFAKNGYVAFILDPIQIAEAFALHHGVGWQEMYDWYARGYTPAGVEVWNAMRAIDYLQTRSEVEPDRIGMTGRSGGAAMSWFTAAVDPRVKVVAPVMGISTYAANVAANTQRGHCDCMFTINSWGHDMLHQGALIAPRPLLMAHGVKDALFPVAGYTEFQERVGALYSAYGKADAFRNIVVDTGHADSDFLREQAIRWFDRHLMGVPERTLDMSYTNAEPERLAVFADGPPADAMNYRVHETFTTRPPSGRFATTAAWEARRAELMERLHRMIERPRGVKVKALAGRELEIEVENGVPLRAILRRAGKATGQVPAVLYVASDGEDTRAIDQLLQAIHQRDDSVRLVVYPRGVGEAPWPKSFWKDTLRNAMHVGQTVDSMRLTDVLAGLEALRREPTVDPARIMLLGKGISGALALYAAILDPAVAQVTWLDPPETHVQGPLLLNILRYTDLPEAAGLLAPRRLNFYARIPAAYEYTRHIYALSGQPDRLFLTMSLPAALHGRYHHRFSSGF